jgi:hypothetical protein
MDTLEPAVLEKIKDALDFDHMSKAEQGEFLLDLGEQIYKGTILRSLLAMDEGTRTGFIDLIEKDAPQEILADYIEKHVSNSEVLAQGVVTDLLNDILTVVG